MTRNTPDTLLQALESTMGRPNATAERMRIATALYACNLTDAQRNRLHDLMERGRDTPSTTTQRRDAEPAAATSGVSGKMLTGELWNAMRFERYPKSAMHLGGTEISDICDRLCAAEPEQRISELNRRQRTILGNAAPSKREHLIFLYLVHTLLTHRLLNSEQHERLAQPIRDGMPEQDDSDESNEEADDLSASDVNALLRNTDDPAEAGDVRLTDEEWEEQTEDAYHNRSRERRARRTGTST